MTNRKTGQKQYATNHSIYGHKNKDLSSPVPTETKFNLRYDRKWKPCNFIVGILLQHYINTHKNKWKDAWTHWRWNEIKYSKKLQKAYIPNQPNLKNYIFITESICKTHLICERHWQVTYHIWTGIMIVNEYREGICAPGSNKIRSYKISDSFILTLRLIPRADGWMIQLQDSPGKPFRPGGTSKFRELWSPAWQQLGPWSRSTSRSRHGVKWKGLSQVSCIPNINVLSLILQKIWARLNICDGQTDGPTDRRMRFEVTRFRKRQGTIKRFNESQEFEALLMHNSMLCDNHDLNICQVIHFLHVLALSMENLTQLAHFCDDILETSSQNTYMCLHIGKLTHLGKFNDFGDDVFPEYLHVLAHRCPWGIWHSCGTFWWQYLPGIQRFPVYSTGSDTDYW